MEQTLEQERAERAEECKNTLRKVVKDRHSNHVMRLYEHQRDAFLEDFGQPYALFIKREGVER